MTNHSYLFILDSFTLYLSNLTNNTWLVSSSHPWIFTFDMSLLIYTLQLSRSTCHSWYISLYRVQLIYHSLLVTLDFSLWTCPSWLSLLNCCSWNIPINLLLLTWHSWLVTCDLKLSTYYSLFGIRHWLRLTCYILLVTFDLLFLTIQSWLDTLM